MKFTIDSKDFKTAITKVLQLKDGILSSLQRVYITVNAEAGKAELLATNIDEYIKVYISDCYNLESGKAVIDRTDLKLLEKLKGELTISDIDTEKLLVQTDKKKLKINNYMWTDEFLDIPELKDLQKVLVTDEAWLLETVTNLSKFTITKDPQKFKQVFNFNIEDKQVEAVDGYKIGIRYFNNRVRTIEEAEHHISLIKRQIEENRDRYESCIKGSTDKMLKFANQLRVIDIEESNFKHDDNYANAKPIWT